MEPIRKAFVSMWRNATVPPAPTRAEAPAASAPVPRPRPESSPRVDLEALRREFSAMARAEVVAEVAAERARMKAAMDVVPELVAALQTERKQVLTAAADDVVVMVVELCRKLLGESLTQDSAALSALVKESLARIPAGDVEVRVPASRVAAVEAVVAASGARVVADPQIKAGCVVKARDVGVDATLDTMMVGVEAAAKRWRETVR